MYGRFSDAHKRVVRSFVRGRTVVDLGAGDCFRTAVLAELGPKSVIAVDPDLPTEPRSFGEPTAPVEMLPWSAYEFARRYTARIDVLYLAWPYPGLEREGFKELTDRADLVIYVGSNVEGSACGPTHFFMRMLQREVLAYRPERENTLIVYGEPCPHRAEPYYEELMGLSMPVQSGPLPFSGELGPLSAMKSMILMAAINDKYTELVAATAPDDEKRASFRDAVRAQRERLKEA